MPLNAGVLIIGSLLWDRTRRPAWRDARLDMASAQNGDGADSLRPHVRNREATPTQWYFPGWSGRAMQKSFTARTHYVAGGSDCGSGVPLWKPSSRARMRVELRRDWGCVALLCNPERKIPEDLLKAWAERVAVNLTTEMCRRPKRKAGLEQGRSCFRSIGLVASRGGGPVQLDLLLVTANDPTLSATPPSYPSVETIADAGTAASKHAEYFWKNVDNGITHLSGR